MGSREEVQWIRVDSTDLLRSAFDSCSTCFPQDEIDPWEWWIDEFDRTAEGTHEHPYVCLVCVLDEKIIGGITWNSFPKGKKAIAAIGFLWIDGSKAQMRGKGYGRATFAKARGLMLSDAEARGQILDAIILEANIDPIGGVLEDTRPFWEKMGFTSIGSDAYYLPSLMFHPETGKPLNAPIRLELMVKPESSSMPVEELLEFVREIYFDWYQPDRADFTNSDAHREAGAYVKGLFDSFAATLSRREPASIPSS